MFLDALWLPYRRDRGKLEAALAAATAATARAGPQGAAGAGAGDSALQAVFAHTDIVSWGGRGCTVPTHTVGAFLAAPCCGLWLMAPVPALPCSATHPTPCRFPSSLFSAWHMQIHGPPYPPTPGPQPLPTPTPQTLTRPLPPQRAAHPPPTPPGPLQIGALMNEAYQAHDGLPPDLFPADIPTYTGGDFFLFLSGGEAAGGQGRALGARLAAPLGGTWERPGLGLWLTQSLA